MKLKDSGWLGKLIKALKNWKEHATTYGSDSDGSKAHGSDVMTLLFENAQYLDEYQRKFGASTISQQHILHFVSNADRFTSVGIKGMGGENDYLAFCEDGFLIADFEKWQKNKAEAKQEQQSQRTETSREIELIEQIIGQLEGWEKKYLPDNPQAGKIRLVDIVSDKPVKSLVRRLQWRKYQPEVDEVKTECTKILRWSRTTEGVPSQKDIDDNPFVGDEKRFSLKLTDTLQGILENLKADLTPEKQVEANRNGDLAPELVKALKQADESLERWEMKTKDSDTFNNGWGSGEDSYCPKKSLESTISFLKSLGYEVEAEYIEKATAALSENIISLDYAYKKNDATKESYLLWKERFLTPLRNYLSALIQKFETSGLIPSPVLAASVQNKLDNGIKDEPEENKAYIKKGTSVWEFGFNSGTAQVKFKPNKELKGLALVEFLLIHPNKEYTPLKLLQETGQREKGETEPEKIYTDKDIGQITKAIEGLKGRAESTTDLEEKARFEKEIKDAEAILHKTRNCKGESRKSSEKYTKSVSRNIETVLKKIAPKNTQLYNHLDTFLKRGEICYYKPDTEIFWEIS